MALGHGAAWRCGPNLCTSCRAHPRSDQFGVNEDALFKGDFDVNAVQVRVCTWRGVTGGFAWLRRHPRWVSL